MNDRDGQVVLLTGGSGAVGEQVVVRYLLEQDKSELRLLLRDSSSTPAAAKLAQIQDLARSQGVGDSEFSARVRLVRGDVTLPKLGLDDGDARALMATTTAILHCAATTKFSVSWPDAERINVDGTANVLAFAESCAGLERLGYVSTAFVAGKRTGFIRESELEHECDFVNHYERSKYVAEQLVRQAMARLPIAVYRLSTLFGDSTTGEVRTFGAIHSCLRLYYRGLGTALPGDPDSIVHLLPVDFAATALFASFERDFIPASTRHIVAPPELALTLSAFLQQSQQAFLSADPGWSRKGIELPEIVDLETFELIRHSADLIMDPTLQKVMALISVFAPQQAYPKVFQSSLGDLVEPPKALTTYLPKVVAACLASGWGRRNRSAVRV